MPIDVLQSKRHLLLSYIVTAGFFFSFFANLTFAETAHFAQKLSAITSKANSKNEISVSVIDLNSGKEVFNFNSNKSLKPASVLKIVTSLVALKVLGPEYRFRTLLYQSGASFYVKGLGDPSFITESMWIFARKIKKLGIKKMDRLVFDSSAFMQPPERSGQRAYESSASALAFNYDSIAIEVCPTKAGSAAIVTSDPWDMPVEISSSVKTVGKGTTSISIEENKINLDSDKMSYSVSGIIVADDECKVIYRSVANPSEYFAYSLQGFLQMLGVSAPRQFSYSQVPSGAELIFQQLSKPLAQIIQDLNHFSTNFIAEQIVYMLGKQSEDPAIFDHELGLNKIKSFLKEKGFSQNDFEIVDGSGLSHKNRLTSALLAKLLLLADRDEDLKAEFEVSLSVAARSGTLKKRKLNFPGTFVRGKTGSLDGVSSLAGYINKDNGERYAFAILQNNVASKDAAVDIEDSIVEAISGS